MTEGIVTGFGFVMICWATCLIPVAATALMRKLGS